MDAFEFVLLGIVQGLTEFLPISSSGHLELMKAILGNNAMPEESLLTTVILHFATALSTLVVFRKDVMGLLNGIFQFKNNESLIFSIKIILSMIPGGLVGFFLEEEIESLFQNSVLLVGFMLMITAGLLLLADRAKTREKGVSFSNSILIGIAQAIAIIPGISRSGATIATSVFLGIDRVKATRFSFLMVIPLIFGKIANDLLYGKIHVQNNNFIAMGLGFVAAFITGIIACKWMIVLVKKARLFPFGIYCFIVGLLAIIITLS